MHRSVSSEESLLVLSDNQLESSDAQAFAELGSRQQLRSHVASYKHTHAHVHVQTSVGTVCVTIPIK